MEVRGINTPLNEELTKTQYEKESVYNEAYFYRGEELDHQLAEVWLDRRRDCREDRPQHGYYYEDSEGGRTGRLRYLAQCRYRIERHLTTDVIGVALAAPIFFARR